MPRRSSRRNRVETSLEMKCLMLFSLSLLVVISVSFWLCWRVTREVVNTQNPRTAQRLTDRVLTLQHFEKLSLLKNEDFSNYLQNLGKDLSHFDFEHRMILDWEDDPAPNERAVDPFEREMLADFLKVPSDADRDLDLPEFKSQVVTNKNGEEIYQYYQAIRAKESCIQSCHKIIAVENNADIAEGDLMAVMQISFPNRKAKELIRWSWSWLMGASIITAFLALLSFYLVIRYLILRPLQHLQDVSDTISHGGDMTQRAEIHTGDEFESLAVAFNRMLRHLMTIQDKLKSTNTDLDLKVDQLAQMNVQLYETNRVKSDFMATMSHELRTPLNSILGFSDVLGSISTLDGKQRRYVENINKSGRILLTMINDVLDLAKMESGQGQVRLAEFPIYRLIVAQADMSRPLADRKNIDIEILTESDLPELRQDESRIQQVISNLLSNAIKFTPEGGRVTIDASQQLLQRPDRALHDSTGTIGPAELVLRVSDTGVGISDDDQAIIFEKFRQGETAMPGRDAMTREHSGTGLGLSIVREICRLLGGEITVESQLGTGSTFTVRLPWRLKTAPQTSLPIDELEQLAGKSGRA